MTHVAYVLARFPVLTESFISGEVLELERQGVRVDLYSIARGGRVGDPRVDALAARTSYLSDESRAGSAVTGLIRWAQGAGGPGRLRLAPALRLDARRSLRFLSWALAIRGSGAAHIHAHFANVPAEVARLLARMTGLPYSFTCHARDIFPPPPDFADSAREAARVVTVCEYNREQLLGAFPSVPPEKIRIVVCGVDPDRFARRRPYAARPFRILAIGRLVEKKGFVHLVHALGRLRDQGIPFTACIVGDGPERSHLAAEIASANLGEAVRLDGEAGSASIREALEAASVLVMPAVVARNGDRDSMPVVIKEAMAMEVPVVGTREVGIPEAVAPETGWLVPSEDPGELARALAEAYDAGPSRLAAMGRRAREVVTEKFTMQGEVAKLRAIFQRGRAS